MHDKIIIILRSHQTIVKSGVTANRTEKPHVHKFKRIQYCVRPFLFSSSLFYVSHIHKHLRVLTWIVIISQRTDAITISIVRKTQQQTIVVRQQKSYTTHTHQILTNKRLYRPVVFKSNEKRVHAPSPLMQRTHARKTHNACRTP